MTGVQAPWQEAFEEAIDTTVWYAMLLYSSLVCLILQIQLARIWFTARSTRPQPFSLPLGTSRQFQVGGHLYASLNRSSLPSDIPAYADMPQPPTPSQLCSCLWSADSYPCLSFLLPFPFVGQRARFATPQDLTPCRLLLQLFLLLLFPAVCTSCHFCEGHELDLMDHPRLMQQT